MKRITLHHVFYCILLWCAVPVAVLRAQDTAATAPKFHFFSKHKMLPARTFDPTERSNYVQFSSISSNARIDYDVYAPFGFGFYQSLVHHGKSEFALSCGMHTQFGIRQENEPYFNGLRKSYLNSDFMLDLNYSYQWKPNILLHGAISHRSTHLGDDYILLKKIGIPNYWSKDPSNYEWVSLAVHHKHGLIVAYERVSFMTRPETFRKRWELQAGMTLSGFKNTTWRRLIAGFDVRALEITHFHPNIQVGAGLRVRENMDLMLVYYNGYVPFSRYEIETKINWLGVRLAFRVLRS